MQKVSQASVVLAVAGITVDAKDDKAVTFYEHFGFYTVAMSNVKPNIPRFIAASTSIQRRMNTWRTFSASITR